MNNSVCGVSLKNGVRAYTESINLLTPFDELRLCFFSLLRFFYLFLFLFFF